MPKKKKSLLNSIMDAFAPRAEAPTKMPMKKKKRALLRKVKPARKKVMRKKVTKMVDQEQAAPLANQKQNVRDIMKPAVAGLTRKKYSRMGEQGVSKDSSRKRRNMVNRSRRRRGK